MTGWVQWIEDAKKLCLYPVAVIVLEDSEEVVCCGLLEGHEKDGTDHYGSYTFAE